ncbi:hypothetical protein PE067_19315 [Paracoccus sp. DMF-8]|uniref:hypothetical protein n=1 Tax=Paracoccus sp. DMF-8 TaxID=3019445 RepID=UPI0023E43CC7|nr:hypothetical protein [Paracoccus sp. DMF-8]MDF3608096.1 hypothetical protein [Paracoccus sp. DMF-8]
MPRPEAATDPRDMPDGWFDLTPELDDRVRALSAAPPRQGDRAHPIHAYLGALGGMPMRIGDFSRALGLAFDAGPVLGECTMTYPGRLRTGQRYRVSTEILDLTRKPSRRFGMADHLVLAITLSDASGPASILRFKMITPVVEDEQRHDTT